MVAPLTLAPMSSFTTNAAEPIESCVTEMLSVPVNWVASALTVNGTEYFPTATLADGLIDISNCRESPGMIVPSPELPKAIQGGAPGFCSVTTALFMGAYPVLRTVNVCVRLPPGFTPTEAVDGIKTGTVTEGRSVATIM